MATIYLKFNEFACVAIQSKIQDKVAYSWVLLMLLAKYFHMLEEAQMIIFNSITKELLKAWGSSDYEVMQKSISRSFVTVLC